MNTWTFCTHTLTTTQQQKSTIQCVKPCLHKAISSHWWDNSYTIRKRQGDGHCMQYLLHAIGCPQAHLHETIGLHKVWKNKSCDMFSKVWYWLLLDKPEVMGQCCLKNSAYKLLPYSVTFILKEACYLSEHCEVLKGRWNVVTTVSLDLWVHLPNFNSLAYKNDAIENYWNWN